MKEKRKKKERMIVKCFCRWKVFGVMAEMQIWALVGWQVRRENSRKLVYTSLELVSIQECEKYTTKYDIIQCCVEHYGALT